jgi:hypothetical protein
MPKRPNAKGHMPKGHRSSSDHYTAMTAKATQMLSSGPQRGNAQRRKISNGAGSKSRRAEQRIIGGTGSKSRRAKISNMQQAISSTAQPQKQ